MVMVVLFTLLLLAGILAATLRLSLGSRQNTADQAATLKAQYGAESRMAEVTQRLRDYQTILSPTRPGPDGTTITNILVPPATTKAELLTYAEQFCNFSAASNPWRATDEFKQARTDKDDDLFDTAQQCMVDGTKVEANQFEVLADIITPEAYAVLEQSAERPSDTSNSDITKAWWTNLLTTQQSGTDWKLNLRARRVVQLTPTRYRFYFGVVNAKARAQDGVTQRVLLASRATDGEWWFEIQLPNLLEDVLMTNHHRARVAADAAYDSAGAPGVNFTDQEFDGSIHTNEKFLFSSSATTKFRDKVSSVGCTDLPRDGRPESGDCSKTVGVYIGNSFKAPSSSSTEAAQRDRSIADQIVAGTKNVDTVAGTTSVDFVKKSDNTVDYGKTDFTASYKPLPENENDQIQAAKDNGLYFGGSVQSLQLKAGDQNGNPLSSYANNKWTETAGNIYQYITVSRKEVSKTRTCATGTWNYADKVSGTGYVPTAAYTNQPSPIEGNIAKQTIIVWRKTRYQIRSVTCKDVESTTVVNEEYRYGPDMVLKKKPTGGNWANATTEKAEFNGVIYAPAFAKVAGPARTNSDTTGALDKAPPALTSFAQMTLASSDDITLSSDLTMSETPCTFAQTRATPPCTRKPRNVLGIYSQNGDIIFDNPLPRNVNVHAAIIASTGQATVKDYNTRTQNGDVKLIGSLIENWYGAFGTFGNSNTGYGRDFTYDNRLNTGIIPPFFPVSPRWDIKQASEVSTNRLFNLISTNTKASSF